MSRDSFKRGKVFRDPVHGLIRVEPDDRFVLELLDTAPVQRLRRVRQLGVSSLTYPGAEHSRFAHTMGVFNFAQRMLGILRSKYGSDSTVSDLIDQNARAIKAAALLHDIGHGPFSHMAERAFGTRRAHETRTVELITSEKSPIRDILSKNKIAIDNVINLITGASEFRLLVDVISSQLDADRMDYILRDAHATGVKYGSFDSEWLLNSLCIGTEPNRKAPGPVNEWRLCLDERRGLHSAEQFMVARIHMSLQVYFHHATRGWEAHLLCLFRAAAALAQKDQLPKSTPDLAADFFKKLGQVDADKFLLIDEATIIASLQHWSTAGTSRLASLASAFLERRKVFHCFDVPSANYRTTMSLSGALKDIGEQEHDWLLDSSDLVTYEDFDSIFRGAKRTDAEISTAAVLLADGTLAAPSRPVESDSIVLRALGDSPVETISRLYCHQDIVEAVKKVLEEHRIL